MKRWFFAVVLGLIGISNALAQCPMCKTAVESNLKNEGATAGLGLNDGILYLLGAPYLLFGTAFFIWYMKKRKAEAEHVHE